MCLTVAYYTLIVYFLDCPFSTCQRHQQVAVEYYGTIQMIAIDRPEKRNAVDPATAKDLFEAFKSFDQDDKMTAAVLYGKGLNSMWFFFTVFVCG